MSNDVADPSVHEPRVIGEIVGTRHTPTGTNEFWGYWAEGHEPAGKVRVVDAEQMREAIAAERERSHELLQAADHIRAGLEAKLAALSAAQIDMLAED